MTSWKDQYITIEDSIIASEGVNNFSNDRYSNASCGCVPNFPGDAICKDSKCINFSTQSECSKCRDGCCNKRIQNRQYAKLDVIETPGKGHGLFAAENLHKMQFVMEYVGELISPQEFSKRSADKSRVMEHQYIMQLKNGVYLDAGRKGSISRFINHSCEPNCFVEVWTVQGRLRVGIFTMVSIPVGTELTFDYKWRPSTRPPTRCHCGTEFCRGYLEIFSKDELDVMKVHNGTWRRGGEPLAQQQQQQGRAVSPTTQSSTEPDTPVPVDDVYNPEGLLIPSKLIGKRVKVWWEGNLAFLEQNSDLLSEICICAGMWWTMLWARRTLGLVLAVLLLLVVLVLLVLVHVVLLTVVLVIILVILIIVSIIVTTTIVIVVVTTAVAPTSPLQLQR